MINFNEKYYMQVTLLMDRLIIIGNREIIVLIDLKILEEISTQLIQRITLFSDNNNVVK